MTESTVLSGLRQPQERALGQVAVTPGSIVVVRDEEWLVTHVDETKDGTLVTVQGMSELVRDITAQFSSIRIVSASTPRGKSAGLAVRPTWQLPEHSGPEDLEVHPMPVEVDGWSDGESPPDSGRATGSDHPR